MNNNNDFTGLKTYQFATSKNGWRNGELILIKDITNKQACDIAYAYSALNGNTEVRYANVTNFDNLEQRHKQREFMGNGIYINNNLLPNDIYFDTVLVD